MLLIVSLKSSLEFPVILLKHRYVIVTHNVNFNESLFTSLSVLTEKSVLSPIKNAKGYSAYQLGYCHLLPEKIGPVKKVLPGQLKA